MVGRIRSTRFIEVLSGVVTRTLRESNRLQPKFEPPVATFPVSCNKLDLAADRAGA